MRFSLPVHLKIWMAFFIASIPGFSLHCGNPLIGNLFEGNVSVGAQIFKYLSKVFVVLQILLILSHIPHIPVRCRDRDCSGIERLDNVLLLGDQTARDDRCSCQCHRFFNDTWHQSRQNLHKIGISGCRTFQRLSRFGIYDKNPVYRIQTNLLRIADKLRLR